MLSLEHTASLTASSALVLKIPKVYQGRIGTCLPSPCLIGSSDITFNSILSSISSGEISI